VPRKRKGSKSRQINFTRSRKRQLEQTRIPGGEHNFAAGGLEVRDGEDEGGGRAVMEWYSVRHTMESLSKKILSPTAIRKSEEQGRSPRRLFGKIHEKRKKTITQSFGRGGGNRVPLRNCNARKKVTHLTRLSSPPRKKKKRIALPRFAGEEEG